MPVERFGKGLETTVGTYRPELDGLRTLAVIVVIINHVSKAALPGGFLGVDIFFVISGYVITSSLAAQQHPSFRSHLLSFMARRMKRLLPALLVCIVATCAVGFLFIPASFEGFQDEWHAGLAALFGVSNIFLYQRSTDYFSSSAELNLFTHTWSLGVEEQFYLLFPSLAWVSGFARSRPRGERHFFVLMALLSAGSLLLYLWLGRTQADAAYYLMPARLWELGAGCLTFLALRGRRPRHQRLLGLLPPLAVLVAMVALLFAPRSALRCTSPALVVLTSLLIATLVAGPTTLVRRALRSGPIVFVGLASYSVYLWHWPILCIARWTLGIESRTIPILVVIVFLVAFGSARYVERRFRNAHWSARPEGTLARGVAATLVCAGLLLILGGPLKGRLTLARDEVLLGIKNRTTEHTWQGRVVWRDEQCLWSDEQVGRPIPDHFCTFDSIGPSQRHFLVIGDSFAMAEIEMVKAIPAGGLGAVTVTSSPGASAVPEVVNTTPWRRANDYYWSTVIPGLLSRLHAGDVVLMLNDMSRFGPAEPNRDTDQERQSLMAGLDRTATELGQRGIGVVIQSVNSFIRDSHCGPRLARKQMNGPGPCRYDTREIARTRRAWLRAALTALERSHANVAVLDLFDLFCPGERCGFFQDDGTALYKDESSHPSAEAAIASQATLLRTIEALTSKMVPALAR